METIIYRNCILSAPVLKKRENMEIKRNVMINKAGGHSSKNTMTYRLSLPVAAINELNVTQKDRSVILEIENGTVTIRKDTHIKPDIK